MKIFNLGFLMCSCGKPGYKTRKYAKKIARRRTGFIGYKLRVYKCPECGDFHLTSSLRGQPFKAGTSRKKDI